MNGYWSPPPLGAQRRYRRPDVGMVVAWDFAVWRVVAVTDVPEVDLSEGESAIPSHWGIARASRPYYLVLRPIGITGDDPRARDQDLHLRATSEAWWSVYTEPEHYPVCAHCGGPVPCRWTEAQRAGEHALRVMSRYETEGVCPACEEPVTTRQRSLTWPDNIELPGGPPVTFHLRASCWRSAQAYERRWVAEAPEQRRAVLSCAGHVTNHNDGTFECTALNECPGSGAGHRSYTVCRCPECHAGGTFGCHPAPSAVRRA